MTRQFFIYTNGDERCTVKDGETEMTYEFTDILQALYFVRCRRAGDTVEVTSFGPTGEVVFRDFV